MSRNLGTALGKRQVQEGGYIDYQTTFGNQAATTTTTQVNSDFDETIPQAYVSHTVKIPPNLYELRQRQIGSGSQNSIGTITPSSVPIRRSDLLWTQNKYDHTGALLAFVAFNQLYVDPSLSQQQFDAQYGFAGVSTSNTSEDGTMPSGGITSYCAGLVTIFNNSPTDTFKEGTLVSVEFPSVDPVKRQHQYANVPVRPGSSPDRITPILKAVSPYSTEKTLSDSLKNVLSFSENAPSINIENLNYPQAGLSAENYVGQAVVCSKLVDAFVIIATLQAMGRIEIKVPDDSSPLAPRHYNKFDGVLNMPISQLIRRKVTKNADGVLETTEDANSADIRDRSRRLTFLAYQFGLMPADPRNSHLVGNQRLIKILGSSANLGHLDQDLAREFGIQNHFPNIGASGGIATSDPNASGLVKRRIQGGSTWNGSSMGSRLARLQNDSSLWVTAALQFAQETFRKKIIGKAVKLSKPGSPLDIILA